MHRLKVVVEGDLACFTRPELKTERVSYDVPTPSAICGMLKAIYWKPAFRYVVDKIVVYNPIDFVCFKRNEVKEKVSFQKMKAKMEGRDRDPAIYRESCINQRRTMALQNVKYGIEFHIELTGLRCEQEGINPAKHEAILKSRIQKGQYFRMPCFGCSEFPVKKVLLVDKFDLEGISDENIKRGDVDLGYMVYQPVFKDEGRPVNNDWDNPVFLDVLKRVDFYRPHMINGVINVEKYREEMAC